MESIELPVTNRCNWFCSYCLVDTHNRDLLPIEEVLKTISEIPDGTSVTLSGGEPGMLERKNIELIIQKLQEKNCNIDLLTNGLFLTRYNDLLVNISEVFYHCIEDIPSFIKNNKEIDFGINLPTHDKFDFIYVIVVLYEDLVSGNAQKIIEKYPDIQFMISPNKLLGKDKIINKFMQFFKLNESRVHPRTKSEFLRNMVLK